MTVLVAAYSPEGFAIAADGRRSFGDGGEPIDNAQKIWSAVRPGTFSLAYGWCGQSRLDSGSNPPFDFPVVTRDILSESGGGPFGTTPHDFIQHLATNVYLRLKDFLGEINLANSTVELENSIVKGMLVGYIRESPVVVELEFSHTDGHLKLPSVRMLDVEEQDFLLCGSIELFAKMEDPVDQTLKAAAECVRRYTQNCVDYRYARSDCASFGGHVHVATVAIDRFDWVIEPIEG